MQSRAAPGEAGRRLTNRLRTLFVNVAVAKANPFCDRPRILDGIAFPRIRANRSSVGSPKSFPRSLSLRALPRNYAPGAYCDAVLGLNIRAIL